MKRITALLIAIVFISLSAFAQEKKSELKLRKNGSVAYVRAKPGKDVIVIINDKKYDSDILEIIDPARIESINVLKGEKALEQYDYESVIIIKTKLKAPEGDKIVIRATGSDKGEELAPLYIIDGEIKSKVDLEAISADDIESVSVLKGESAIKLYGSKAANGVVIIEMKK